MILRFIRHSFTRYNEEGLSSGGSVNSPLSFKGRRLIENLKEEGIYPEDPGVIYCSKLIRTRETLEIIYPDSVIHETALLNERIFGRVELMDREENQRYIKENPKFTEIWEDRDYVPEGGESANMFISRVKRDFNILFDEFLAENYDTVTIGCHGAYYKALSILYGLDPDNGYGDYYFLQNGKGTICEAEKKENGLVLKIAGYIGGNSLNEVGEYIKKTVKMEF